MASLPPPGNFAADNVPSISEAKEVRAFLQTIKSSIFPIKPKPAIASALISLRVYITPLEGLVIVPLVTLLFT